MGPEWIWILALVFLAAILTLGTWKGLIKSYRTKQWGWFLGILTAWFFGLGWLVGWIYLSTRRKTDTGTSRPRLTNRELLGKFLPGAIVITALILLVVAVTSTETKVESQYPKHLEMVTPANGSQNVPSQSSLVADLEFGYRGALIVNGREIPLDQVDETVATGELRFTPGAEKEFKKLPGGVVTATIVFWPTQGTRETDATSYSWVVNVN